MAEAKYPNIHVQLTGEDGNAFFIIGKMRRALMKNNIPKEEIDKFMKEAQSGDYNDLLNTCANWVDVG